MTSYTYFISDLHLCEQYPATTEAFIAFVRQQAPKAEALYILGDFFEAWIGDDHLTPYHVTVIEALKTLSHHTPIFFMHGNRDFLIGHRFAKASHITLLPDPYLIELYGQRITLAHGDLLCTDDTRHQLFRRVTNNHIAQKLFLCLPLTVRKGIARRMRKASQSHLTHAPGHYADLNPHAIETLLTKENSQLLIHGHTHQPAHHPIPLPKQNGHRYVLGAWEGDTAKILAIHSDRSIHFENLSLIKKT